MGDGCVQKVNIRKTGDSRRNPILCPLSDELSDVTVRFRPIIMLLSLPQLSPLLTTVLVHRKLKTPHPTSQQSSKNEILTMVLFRGWTIEQSKSSKCLQYVQVV